ncbi:MAG: ferrous iron transport protein B [Spirochaetales bacterium]|nr:ferrous iron transport protein B [Spirochaetales bacterium]
MGGEGEGKEGIGSGRQNYRVAIVGNPNCGKTTLFNELTGARQKVGNWPGVTIEKKTGFLNINHDIRAEIIDLPGIYSLSAYSLDERIARDYLLKEKPDAIINIVDASNLERNLFLTTQLLELEIPMVIALNLMDAAEKKNLKIDVDILSSHLHLPVVPVVALKGQGVDATVEVVKEVLLGRWHKKKAMVTFGADGERNLTDVQELLKESAARLKLPLRWLAVKLFEGDREYELLLENKELRDRINGYKEKVVKIVGEDTETIIADYRYGFISGLVKEAVKVTADIRITLSEKIDAVIASRILGIPFFALVIFLMFKISIDFSQPGIDYIDSLFASLIDLINNVLVNLHAPAWISIVLVNGVIGGTGTVITFVVPIALVFFFLSFLEDIGYLSRGAFVMDRLMHWMGLPGKAFIPLILGFGCNVPGILATRVMEDEKDRLITILINPFISCGARLPVYIMIAGAVFAQNVGTVVFSLYAVGIAMAIIVGLVFRKTILKGPSTPFVMELPPYRLPTLKGILMHTWENVWSFIKRAGTLIVAIILLLVIIGYLPIGVTPNSKDSVLGKIGTAIAPVFKPQGFADWKASVALFTGIFAKEAVVGTMAALYGVEEKNSSGNPETKSINGKDTLKERIARDFTPLSAYSFLLFILLYSPCVATMGAIAKEAGLKWAIFSVLFNITVAYIISMTVFQIGTLIQKLL